MAWLCGGCLLWGEEPPPWAAVPQGLPLDRKPAAPLIGSPGCRGPEHRGAAPRSLGKGGCLGPTPSRFWGDWSLDTRIFSSPLCDSSVLVCCKFWSPRNRTRGLGQVLPSSEPQFLLLQNTQLRLNHSEFFLA